MKNVIVIGLIVALSACGNSNNNINRGGNEYSTNSTQSDAIEMLVSVFSGIYTKEQLKTKMDMVLDMYNMPLTKESYLKAGNMLVELRKSANGQIKEFDIIDDMITASSGSKGVSFGDQANISVKTLENKYFQETTGVSGRYKKD